MLTLQTIEELEKLATPELKNWLRCISKKLTDNLPGILSAAKWALMNGYKGE